jgi:hypothetical protein
MVGYWDVLNTRVAESSESDQSNVSCEDANERKTT